MRELVVDGKECIYGVERAEAEQLLGRGQPAHLTPRPKGAE